jgi:hypothetical protein
MAVLDLAQNVVDELGLPAITAVVGSSDNMMRQMLSLLIREGKELRSKQEWPQLTRSHSITLVADQEAYEFPGDFDRQIFQTHWDQSNQWELVGPLSPQEWQMQENAIVSLGPRRRFRVKGFAANQFFIDPAPSASEAGQILVFEYQSASWLVPATWETGTSYAAGAFTFYDGNIYSTVLGGTSGATPPTHTSSSASDGGITWVYYDAAYERPRADTDVFLLDQEVLTLGVKWRFMQVNGMQWQLMKKEAENAVSRDKSTLSSAPVLTLCRPRRALFIDYMNLPDGDYGS